MPPNRMPHTDALREIFLAELRKLPNVSRAAKIAGLNRKTLYKDRDDEPDFKDAWDQAIKEGVESMEAEGMRRAIEGVPRMRVSGGKVVLIPELNEDGTVKYDVDGNMTLKPLIEHEYSDTVWCRLMEAHDPERYRKIQDLNLRTPDGGATLNLIEAPGD